MLSNSQVKEIIETDFPGKQIRNIKFIGNGVGNDVFLINNTFMFRFCRWEGESKQLENQRRILDLLQDKTNLPIPQYIYFPGTSALYHHSYVGYKKIKGARLTPRLFNTLPKHIHLSMAKDLGEFLCSLHGFPVEKACQCGIQYETLNTFVHIFFLVENLRKELRINNLLIPATMRKRFQKIINENFEKNTFSFIPALVHFALSDKHIFFDISTKKISGIIDFGNIGINDPFVDFKALLRSYGMTFVKMLLNHYHHPAKTNIIRKLKLYNWIKRLESCLKP